MTSDDQLRAEFEVWAKAHWDLDDDDLDRASNGQYLYPSMNLEYAMYCAAHESGYRSGLEKARALVDAEPVPEGDAPKRMALFNDLCNEIDNLRGKV